MEGRDEFDGGVRLDGVMERDGGLTVAVAVRETGVERSGGERGGGGGVGKSHWFLLSLIDSVF